MSTPTTFFVATAGEALTMDFPGALLGKPTVECKNITPDMVGDLDFLLTGERTREPICIREDDDIAVFRLDQDLVAALGELDDVALQHAADEWGIYDLAGTTSLLTDLRAAAQEARTRDEEMFLSL